jgi:glycosyltransferase involved in cell wall biosynthesis
MVNSRESGLIVGIDATNISNGGGRTHLVELLRAAQPSEVGISKIIIWGGIDTVTLIEDRDWLKKITPEPLNRGLFKRIFWQRFNLSREARDLRCDILFIPGGSYAGNFRPIVALSQNLLPFEWLELKRYGFSFLTLKLIFLRIIQARTFINAEGTIFLTEYAKNIICNVAGKLSGMISLIPHGTNSGFFRLPREQKEIGLYSLNNKFQLLYVSNIDEYKHQWVVVEAVAKLRQKTRWPINLRMVGGAYPPALKKLNSSLKRYDPLGEWSEYMKDVPYQNMQSIYQNADAAIFASSCENMPNILLECMASGLPIACSNMGPMKEILSENGVYFNPENPDEICSVLYELINSPNLRKKNGIAGFEMASLYSWEKCAKNTLTFLAKVANESSKNFSDKLASN